MGYKGLKKWINDNCGQLHGDVAHEDFEGHKGTIGAGNLQWMTAGRGIVYSEMPASSSSNADHSGSVVFWSPVFEIWR
ncbi:putative pirin domain, rmlC-like cupin domain superfamily, rmlC-like jelly roll [Helianthus annuus]|uniref:Pirin domain, rmlC-like cupin domain superfamily, rmlC-like jelly roll n=1 Tax=Helianthus annuus TaxID=4232 RepID=A0A9K3IR72_HELAN|nr:putative pirin domain, rmlC-like cupin domain superfamily, rmlC-like jelly roll [Helianthus annuus]